NSGLNGPSLSILFRLFSNWLLYMTAGPFVADELFKKWSPKWRNTVARRVRAKTRKRIEITILIFGMFWAGFAAFKQEHTAKKKAEQSLRDANRAPIKIEMVDADSRKEIGELRAKLENANK